VLVTIPHFADPNRGHAGDGRAHGSAGDPGPRVRALTDCLTALHNLFGSPRCVLDHFRKVAVPVVPDPAYHLDVVVCTTGDNHLLDRLALPAGTFEHRPTDAAPALLGFECHAALRDRLGGYDFYCYLEDDLVVRDPFHFAKLAWFTANVGDDRLLQPHRYEAGAGAAVGRVYIDGDLRPGVTAGFQTVTDEPELWAEVLGVRVGFRRTLNPHAGCFFLSAAQMARWAARPYFLDRDTRFIGPLESAATLGVLRTFKVYKPALPHAGFFEVEHSGRSHLDFVVHA
jgi:hypothetical protein